MAALMTAVSVLGTPMSASASAGVLSNVRARSRSDSVNWDSKSSRVTVRLDARSTFLAAKEALYQGNAVEGELQLALQDLTDEDGYAFAGNMDLYEVALPEGIRESLGDDAFLRVFVSPDSFGEGPGPAVDGKDTKKYGNAAAATASDASGERAGNSVTANSKEAGRTLQAATASNVDEIARDLGLEEEIKAERKRSLKLVRESVVFDYITSADPEEGSVYEEGLLQQNTEDGEGDADEVKNVISHEITGDETFWFLTGSNTGEDLTWNLKVGDTEIVKKGKIDASEGNAILYRADFDSIYRLFSAEGDGARAEVVTLAKAKFMAKHSLANVERRGEEMELSIRAVSEEEDAYAQAGARMEEKGVRFDGFALYDISFLRDGSEHEPMGKGQIVDVALTFEELPDAMEGQETSGYAVQHLITDACGAISDVETVASASVGEVQAEESFGEGEDNADAAGLSAKTADGAGEADPEPVRLDTAFGSHLAVTEGDGAAASFAMDSFSYVAVTYENAAASKAANALPEKVTGLIRLMDNGASMAEDFPVYVKIEAGDANSDSGEYTSSTVVRVDHADVNQPVTFTLDDYVLTEETRVLNFKMGVYTDEACETSSDEWGYSWGIPEYYSIECVDGYWQVVYYDYETGQDVIVPMTISYRYLDVEVPVTACSTEASLYPVYLKAECFGKTDVVKLEANGDYTVTMKHLDYWGRNYGQISWNLYEDADCVTASSAWAGQAGSKAVQIVYENDYYYLEDTGSYPYKPAVISVAAVVSGSISAETDFDTGNLSGAYPVYMKAVLIDNNTREILGSAEKMLNSAEDAKAALSYSAPDNTLFSSDVNYGIEVSFYTDSSMTEASDVWEACTFSGNLGSGGKLYTDAVELKISYRRLNVDVEPSLFKVQASEAAPAYLYTWASSSAFTMDVPKITPITNEDAVNIAFDKLLGIGSNATVHGILSEQNDRPLTASDATEPTSLNTVFYADEKSGDVRGNGKIQNADGVVVLKPYEAANEKTELKIPVRINLPSDETPYFFNPQNNYRPSAVLRLYHEDPNSGSGQIEYVSGNAYNAKDDYSQCYCFTPVEAFTAGADSLAGEVSVFVNKLVPGEYALEWMIAPVYKTASSAYSSYTDRNWTTGVTRVKVREDGSVVDENDTPVLVEIDWLKHVIPKIKVHAEYPDEYNESLSNTQSDQYTPVSFQFLIEKNPDGWDYHTVSFRTSNQDAEGHYIPNIPEGDSLIDSSNRQYAYGLDFLNVLSGGASTWTDLPVAEGLDYATLASSDASIDLGGVWADHYPEDSIVGFPVGDYGFSYDMGKWSIDALWESFSGKLHLAEDGQFYRIKEDGSYETEPFVINIRYIGEKKTSLDTLKIKVNTTLQEGIAPEKAFTAGDKLVVVMSEARSQNYSYTFEPYYAVGVTEVTETGITEVELTKPGGGNFTLHNPASYYFSIGTFHEWDGTFDKENANVAWHFSDSVQDMTSYYPIHWDPSRYYAYYPHNSDRFVSLPADSIDENGVIRSVDDYDNGSGEYTFGDAFIIENPCLLMPWTVTDPGSIAASEADDAVVYKPIEDISVIKEKGNYIIVAYNAYDQNWYALSTDDEGGNSVKLEGISSFEDLQNGIKIGETAEYKKMVFTASKVSAGSDSASLQLKTKDDAGKTLALKMGSSSKEPLPLISNSAGTVIIWPGQDDYQFSVSKGNYAQLQYVDELYGYSGFRTASSLYGFLYDDGSMINYGYDYEPSRYGDGYENRQNNGYIHGLYKFQENYHDPVLHTFNGGIIAGRDPHRAGEDLFVADIDPSYIGNDEYLQKLADISSQMGSGSDSFYILSDDTEAEAAQNINKYTLVRTYGDFVNTFVPTKDSYGNYLWADGNRMIFIYTDEDGREYAMNPAGLSPVETKAVSAGYREVNTVADHELIPNNYSGTSSFFKISNTEVSGSGEYVIASEYAFRKSRQNAATDENYLVLSEEDTAWSKSNDKSTNVVYVMHPESPVYSQADWDAAQSYKLSVVRDGITSWLGIRDDGTGKLKMVTVSSEADAADFTVYAPSLTRYYSSVLGTDLNKYFKVSDVTEINAGDELLLIYKDNDGERHIIGTPQGNDVGISSAYVLDAYDQIDIRSDAVNSDSRLRYRLGTSEYIKKPFAYIDPENPEIIRAQGVSAVGVGNARSETSSQRKYESVRALGNTSRNVYAYIKTGYYVFGYNEKAQVNFFQGDRPGEFFIRGGKSDAWVGAGSYEIRSLDLDSGEYVSVGDEVCFLTVEKEDRIPVEVYRRTSTDDSFTVTYHDIDLNEIRSETKPKDSFTLTQQPDIEYDGESYIFVGWTTDEGKAGYLSLADSANLYDYEDLPKRAGLKDEAKERLGVLSDCNPEVSNVIEYSEVEDAVSDGNLNVYPVYALRGYSTAVTANDTRSDGTEQMIIGASDFKDLQNGNNGVTDPKERWLGSINIEIYKDGGTWVPGGGSTTGRKRLMAPRAVQKATLYFAYHNDNAADLNIKFIEDGITADTLYEYMSSSDFSVAEPSHQYAIDAVWAEQGGSEDGLKYRYNWMDKVVGGQLDNVRGGSTVKVYVTSKYQIKYYFDNGDGNGYQQLRDEAWTDENFYTTEGTEKAVESNRETADYVIVKDDESAEEKFVKMIEKTPGEGTTFKDEKIIRGEYSIFQYEFDTYDHVIPVAKLPDGELIPADKELDGDQWTVRDAELEEMEYNGGSTIAPSTRMTVTDTVYGTGNTVWSYENEDLGDVTNTYHLYISVEKDVVDLKFTKVWSDADNQDGIRLTAEEFKAKLHLMNGDTEVKDCEPAVTDNGDGTFTVLYKNLPKYEEGGETADGTAASGAEEIVYTVKEDEIPGYTADKTVVGDKDRITNTHTPETTEVTVTKVWDDSENKDGIRPESVTIRLLADGEAVPENETPDEAGTAEAGVTIGEAEKWTHTWTGLPKYKDGAEIVYTVEEAEADVPKGYTAKVSGDAETGFTVTNTHEPEMAEITVIKAWDDAENQDGVRSESITVKLLADGADTGRTLVLDEAGKWTGSFAGLEKYSDGVKITYTVEEEVPAGYKLTDVSNDVNNVFTITNSHTPEVTEVAVTKVWDDNDDQDGKRPASVTVKLLADGEDTGKTLVLDEAGEWTGTFEGLDKFAAGQEIKYTVEEESVPSDYARNISGTAAEGYTITNSHEPGTTAVNATKVWDDSDDWDGIRPASVKVQLYADGTAEGGAAELNEANSWSYGWAGLPEKKGGKTIVYTVKETAVPEGYTAETAGDAKSGYTITNSHTPEVTEVKVTKVWDDSEDQDGIRPAGVKVQLYADGAAEGAAVELGEASGWTHTWTALPKMAAGKEIAYTVDETEVPAEYTKKISGTAAAGYTITNSHTPAAPTPTPTPGGGGNYGGGGGGTPHWPGFEPDNNPVTPTSGVLGESRLPGIVSAVLGDYREPQGVLGASRTGDDAAVAFAGIMMLMAFFGMAGLFIGRRKENER